MEEDVPTTNVDEEDDKSKQDDNGKDPFIAAKLHNAEPHQEEQMKEL